MAKDNNVVERYCKDLEDCIFEATVQALCYCGEKAVADARNPHPNDWEDHTGNLRSSIGYIVTYNGKDVTPKNEIYSAFDESKQKPEHKELVSFTAYKPKQKQVSFMATVEAGTEGAREGRLFAESLKGSYPEGFALIVVAGMNYAESVEAHGRDVIASAEIKARDWWRKYEKGLPKKVEALMKKKGW